MTLTFSGEVWYWKGPAPFYFVTVPPAEAAKLREVARLVTYGWGMIPASATVGSTTLTTALFPKDGSYVVPLKVALRRAERVEEGDTVTVKLQVGG